jgi:CheY-like chemotaxis protein
LKFDIIDTGIGMSPEQLSVLFSPFSQADGSVTRKFGGTGLGLAISRRLAFLLGGDVSVHSAPGRGSTVSVTVDSGPLDGVRMVGAAHGQLGDEPCEVSVPPQALPRLCGRILLAEDGPDNQRLIGFLLRKAGAEVAIADNGQRALDMVLEARDAGRSFDVILMDVQMPVMDGYEATRRLRLAGIPAPIVALTAHALTDDRDKCLAAGCDDYVTKPVQRASLLATIARYLSGEPTRAAGVAADQGGQGREVSG